VRRAAQCPSLAGHGEWTAGPAWKRRHMPHVVIRPRGVCFVLLLTLWPVGCRSSSQPQPPPRYVVTASPIDVGLGPSGVCVAVDPLDRRGVWWWEPGASGCATRSTGPGLFHADKATVSRSVHSGPTALSFRLQTHSTTRPFIDVRLLVDDGNMRALESGARVLTSRRHDLDIPELPDR